MRRRPENMWNKVQRFSIRKFSFGVTSALVGTFFLANASMVQASSIEKEAGIQKNQLEINKVAEDSLKENKVEVKKEKTVEKNHLSEVINELTDILATVNKDKVSKSSLLQFETTLSQAKSVLQNESATQEEVDSVERSLKNSLSIIKSMPKLSTLSDEKEKRNTVPQKETVETPSSKVQEEVSSPKTQEEKNVSLKQIQKDLQNYLTAIEGKENKETKVEEAKSILANITTQLENPTLSSEELTVLLKQASQVRNSIVNEVLRENSGARDSRNGLNMGEGVHLRANGEINSGALANIKYFASVDPRDNNGNNTRNNDPEYTRNHTDIKAYYMQDSEGKWIVYDVFFNNNGRKITDNSYQEHYYFQAPFNIMDLNSNGTYKSNTIKDLKFTRYRNTGGSRLSDGFQGFERYGNTAVISKPWEQQYRIFDADRDTFYDPYSGVYRENQRWSVFKNNQNDPTLNELPKNKNNGYPGLSYYLGVDVRRGSTDYAMHMHVKIKLKDNVTTEEAARYGRVYAATVAKAPTANRSFIMGAAGTRLTTKTDAQLSPIQGSTHNKTVGDTLPNPDNPVAAKYITPKNGGEFPGGMSWSWKNNIKPSTAEAGVFRYTAVATYQDGSKSDAANSGSDGTVTLNVKPIKPTITANDVVHKKGLTNQTITVNVGTGVKDGSTVTLYDGANVIGRGTTNGTTARITVSSALPGRPITAVTTVNNNGTVISEKSDGVTPTDAPDNQAPTVKMTNPTDENRVSVLTSNETNAPTTRIYRGATLNVPLSMYDNDPKGKVNLKYVSGLPKGVTFNNGTTLSKNGATETNPGTTNVTGKVAADAQLGKQTVTFKVSDDQGNNVDSGNRATVKFNVEVVDLAFQKNKGEVKTDGTLVVKTAKGTSYTDSHDFITTTDGTNVGDQFFAGGMKFRFIDSNGTTTSKVTLNTPGKHNVKAAAYFHDGYAGTNGVDKVTNNTPGKDNEIINRSFLYKNIEFQVKPTAPTVTPETNGDVTVTPVAEENVNTFNFTYNDPNNTPKTVTATKTNNGWTLSNAPADGVTIDRTTGKVTIKDRAIKDSIPVTAKSVTNDNVESDPSRANSNVGDNEPPKFKFTSNGKETRVETGGEQVAYITPTEDTNLKIGTVTDNSGKLSEVKFADKANRIFGIQGLGSGITYNEVAKTNNGDVDAPRDIIVSGKLPERNGNATWTDDVAITRFVVAKDAALKEMRDQNENVSNPTRVKLKVLTQATKYVPHVENQVINKDITAPGATVTQAEFDTIKSNITFTSDRGDVKISNGANNRTAGLNITMKDNGAIQKDPANGSYYVNARIEYPDHSTEDVRIPVAKSDTTAPKVTINGKELSETATDYSFIVFKGSTFNPTLRVSDDKNDVKSVSVTGLPSGNNFSATGNWSKNGEDVQVTGNTITATNNAQLGDHEASIVVKDVLNNEKTYKFKYKVVDVEIKETPKTVPLNTQLGDSHNYVKVVDGTNNDGDDKYYPDGMSFKWKKDTAEVPNGTRLSRPGIVSEYKPEVKFKSGAGFYTKTIDGKEVKVYTPATIVKDQVFRVKPTAPTITPLEKGDVTVTPVSEENVNRLSFTYKHPNDSTITVTATKNGNRWSLTSGAPGDGVTIDPDTGVVTIKDRAIKDATEVTAKSVTTDSVDSDTTRENSKVGDTEPPVFTFTPDGKEKVVDNGRQVVYVTPTEETDLNIGVVTDNSGKLVQAIFRETNGNTSSGLGFPGLNHNGLPRTDNVEVDAPRNILVTGKVSEYKTGTTPWADTDEFTRGMYARDAATNEIRNTPEHPTNVVFKVLTQATKYEPQVSAQPVNVDVAATNAKISQSDFDALKSNITFDSTRGPVKIDNTTTGLKISMQEDGAIKQNPDGSHYVGATIEYPDHSRDEIRIPVVKADANVPSATMDGMLLTNDVNTTANFVVFKGAKFNPTFNVRDDRNNITKLKVTGLPNGSTFEQTGNWTSGSRVQVTGDNYITTDTSTLGEHEGTVEVTDSSNNTGTYKFKYKVVDVEVRNSPKTVELGTKLVDAANANNGQDSHNYVKVVDAPNASGDDKYYPAGMNFKWSKNNAEITTSTEFNKPGVVTDYKALVKFASGAGFYTKSIDGKTIKVYTPASIEKEVTFHVAPPKPTFNQDAVSSTTRTISGTLGGFTSDDRVVEVHLNDKDKTVLSSKDGQVTINGDTWTATLPDNVKLRQSKNKNGETEKQRNHYQLL